MGVFDPGINALSIATRLLPPFTLSEASLTVPANRQAPIAASLRFADDAGLLIAAEFDFREQGDEVWEIEIETDAGRLVLSKGGGALAIDGRDLAVGASDEYGGLYEKFISLISTGRSEVDIAPLTQVADGFMLGTRVTGEEFHW